MKAIKRSTLLAAAAVFALAGWAQPATAQPAIASQAGLGQVAKADEVYGNEVISSDNQKIGKLNNLMVDLESGRVLYGVLGASKGKVAIAPQLFTSTLPIDRELHLRATKAKLETARQFTADMDKPGQWGQASFVDEVYTYYGQRPWWQGSAPANQGTFHNVHKASQVIGMKVENVNNQSLGEVNNLIVNLPAGRLVYVILSPASSLALGNNLYVLPPQAFTLSADQKNLVSGIDGQKLAAAPHFDKSKWPNLSDTAFAARVYEYYGKQPYFQIGGAIQPTGR